MGLSMLLCSITPAPHAELNFHSAMGRRRRGRKRRRRSSSSSLAVRAESKGAAGAPCPAPAPRRLSDAPPRLTSGTSWHHPGRPPELGFQGSAARTGSSSLPPLSLSGTLTLRLSGLSLFPCSPPPGASPGALPLGAMPPGAGVLPGGQVSASSPH